jgi:hypothetical protein
LTNSRAGTTETFDATATPVDIIRGLNLDIKLPNDKFNIFYVSSQQMPRRMERVGKSGGISRRGCSRRIDRSIDTSSRYINSYVSGHRAHRRDTLVRAAADSWAATASGVVLCLNLNLP